MPGSDFVRSRPQPHTLVFVPSYLDFVRVRNFLNSKESSFVTCSEYSDVRRLPLPPCTLQLFFFSSSLGSSFRSSTAKCFNKLHEELTLDVGYAKQVSDVARSRQVSSLLLTHVRHAMPGADVSCATSAVTPGVLSRRQRHA
eukprot:2999856-Rhodomonas_salina.1